MKLRPRIGAPRTLRSRLAISFALVILFSTGMIVLTMEVLVRYAAEEVTVIINRRRAFRFAPVFADYFQRKGSWEGVSMLAGELVTPIPVELTPRRPILQNGPPLRILDIIGMVEQNRVILADGEARVIVDTGGEYERATRLPLSLTDQAVPVMDGGRPVGLLVSLSNYEDDDLYGVRRPIGRLLGTLAVVSSISAAALSLFFAHRLTRSLRTLTRAARRFADGEAVDPLPITTEDEVGILTRNFNEMVAALEKQQMLRKQMVADIAHELRTPLSVMQLDIEGLADGMQTPEEASDSIRSELHKLQRLINDLRWLSLADAGVLQFEREPLALTPFLRGVAASWRNRFNANQVDLRAGVADDLPTIDADPVRLAQVFNNLLSNALRFTPGGKAVTLAARREAEEVEIRVEDAGPGIDPEKMEMIFERFFRADVSRSRDTGGTGLGLAIAKQWVLFHGGKIWAENGPTGARFIVTLPARRSLSEAGRVPERASEVAYHKDQMVEKKDGR